MKSNAQSMPAPVKTGTSQTARAVPCVIPGGTVSSPGEFPITQAGNRFYVLACSASVIIQPVSARSTGVSNLYGVGQGANLANDFDTLTVKNTTANPITALIWVGYDDFVNDQLIFANALPNVMCPTFPTAGAAGPINFNDLSGTKFIDINGKGWYAVSRVAIILCNTDSGTPLLLQKKGATTSSGVAVANCPANQNLNLPLQGDYSVSNAGTAAVNAIGSEIYQAFPA